MTPKGMTALSLFLLESTDGQKQDLLFTWSSMLSIKNLNYLLIKLGFVPESSIILLLYSFVNELLHVKNQRKNEG